MASPDPTTTYVLARVGGVPIAVAAQAVRAVLPMPPQWHRLPRRQGAIVGVLPTAQGPQALVELSAWVELQAPPGDTGVALVLQDAQGRSVALRLDALEGLHRAGRGGVRALYRDDNDDELFAAVLASPGQTDAQVDGVCVLEAERLMRLAQCWAEGLDLAQDATRAPADAARTPGAALHAVVRLAGPAGAAPTLLAVPACDVAEVLHCPAYTHRWAPGGTTVGLTAGLAEWRSRAVAVLSPAGLGLTASDTPPLALMLEDAQGRGLLMPVSEMLGLHLLPADSTRGGDTWVTPAQDSPLGPIQTLRTVALLQALPEASLSHRESSGPGTGAPAVQRNLEPYLVFDAGRRFAMPISQVHAVLARPPGVDVIDWRDERLTLAAVPGLPPLPPDSEGSVIVVGSPGARAAWAVARPHAFIPSRAAELRGWRSHSTPGAQLLCVDEPAATYPVLQAPELQP
ncbi:chemotaxis protein CheW [Roseateles paludis]|uniref:Chemotaxis protein CheW n=1 Tax=Roseateles paludis TaxID=3145238 RepID=A0ABV0G423_9BURK